MGQVGSQRNERAFHTAAALCPEPCSCAGARAEGFADTQRNAMPRLEQIWLKRMKRGPMDRVDEATLVAGRGLVGNANQGGHRQVTILSADRWREIVASVGVPLDPSTRRANLLVSGVELAETRGRVLRVGGCRLQINGETRPCERMDEAHQGLRAVMGERWGGGVYAAVLDDGAIGIGDEVGWDDMDAPKST
jgi:MOSC domain-containing protein YiiM